MGAIGRMGAVSANLGQADELATLHARTPGDYYILVLSNNGAFGPDPYQLQARHRSAG